MRRYVNENPEKPPRIACNKEEFFTTTPLEGER
jgi:hypothetical protein